MLGEQLGNAFIGELQKSFLQLLGLHRILVDHFFEDLRRKGRNAGVIEVLAFGECITDLEVAGIKQTNYIAGECFFNDVLISGHERVWVGEAHVFVEAHVVKIFIPLKPAAHHAEERDPIPVTRIEVGVDLKDEAAEFVFMHTHLAGTGLHIPGFRGNADKSIQQFFDTKVINGRSKEYRCNLAL